MSARLLHGETNLLPPAAWKNASFRHKRVIAAEMFDSNSSYAFRKTIAMAIAAIITLFGSKPLARILYLSLLSSGTAALVVGGVIVLSIDVAGIFISRIFLGAKEWPTSLAEAIHRSDLVQAPLAAIELRWGYKWQG